MTPKPICKCCGGELEPDEERAFWVDDDPAYDPLMCSGCNDSQGHVGGVRA